MEEALKRRNYRDILYYKGRMFIRSLTDMPCRGCPLKNIGCIDTRSYICGGYHKVEGLRELKRRL